MKINKIVVYGAILEFLIHIPIALADDVVDSKPQFSAGLKVWNSSWLSYLPSSIAGANGLVADSVDAVEGNRRTTVLPALSVRYKDYFVSTSYGHYSNNFSVLHSINFDKQKKSNFISSRSDHITRNETDIAAGYYVTPNIALSLGYKYAKENREASYGDNPGVFNPLFDSTVKSVLFGVLANFPIQGRLGFYGQLGVGPTRVNISFPPGGDVSQIDAHGSYLISETGVVYALPVSNLFVKGANLGLGYRSQTLKTNSKGPSNRDPRDYRDVKDGVVFSLSVAI